MTPVVLPGFDDPRKLRRRLFAARQPGEKYIDERSQKDLFAKLNSRIDRLLRKAIRQSGYADALAENATVEWSAVGLLPGADLVTRYALPEKLRRFRRLHVRITWRDSTGQPIALPGPVCLGAGRFHGLGLFVNQ